MRVDFGDERSWAEHVEGNVYRSLSSTLSNVPLKLPKEHEFAHRNGQPANLRWGHLFEAEKISEHGVRPLFIIGQDLTPRVEED